MKKLALLLAALGVVSAAAYAAPELTVTSVGQEVEIEHTLGSDDTTAWLYNNVGLAYGDWTFGLQAAKQWNYDDKDNFNAKGVWEGKGITSNNSRVQFDSWKKINDNLKLGLRYRGQKNMDRFQVKYDFNYGMLWSAGDFWYQFNNGGNDDDNFEMEWFPIGLKYGAFKVGYFLNYGEYFGDSEGVESYTEHQIRAYADLYKTDKLTVFSELRVTLNHEKDIVNGEAYKAYDDFGRNRLYLGAKYNVTESLNVYGKYAYELGDEITKDGKAENKHTKDYEALIFGWSYSF